MTSLTQTNAQNCVLEVHQASLGPSSPHLTPLAQRAGSGFILLPCQNCLLLDFNPTFGVIFPFTSSLSCGNLPGYPARATALSQDKRSQEAGAIEPKSKLERILGHTFS